ncbi:hypothetical protein [Spirosoma validum]|uniref:Uncharacterized protein n=1 Tax=Spirosoma validum TaxID=2771355 RepID=A0A927B4A9_9BACT|nr:hypothetical protein [Spirosoma validum]MBD2755390.1 hypothetical protein [Spirosoma validum]
MLRIKQVLIVISMVIVWGITSVITLGSPTLKGKTSILLSGVFLNTLLGVYYSYLKQRPASFKEWIKQ